jgi:hypothetical protein
MKTLLDPALLNPIVALDKRRNLARGLRGHNVGVLTRRGGDKMNLRNLGRQKRDRRINIRSVNWSHEIVALLILIGVCTRLKTRRRYLLPPPLICVPEDVAVTPVKFVA